MSVNSSGLASLTATYTDSEGEDEPKEEESPLSEKQEEIIENPRPSKQHTRRLAQLVSYNDDTVVSDDEGVADSEAHARENDSSVVIPHPEKPKEEVIIAVEEEEIFEEEEDENDVKLPPEPNGKCSVELQDKISHLYKRMKSSVGFDMNEIIQKRKEFRNPSIYEKLIQFCGINELGTNYPAHIYDPELWGKESYYEELAKVQKAEMDKREKERKEKTKVEFVSGTAKRNSNSSSAHEDDKKRKSKWDQVGGLASGTISAPSLLRPVGLTQPAALNSSSAGTGAGAKATVISAFGSLPKKPRI